jgi:hypothetical protein
MPQLMTRPDVCHGKRQTGNQESRQEMCSKKHNCNRHSKRWPDLATSLSQHSSCPYEHHLIVKRLTSARLGRDQKEDLKEQGSMTVTQRPPLQDDYKCVQTKPLKAQKIQFHHKIPLPLASLLSEALTHPRDKA